MFETKGPGGKSYREIAVELFKDLLPGAFLSYKQLADAMGLSVKNDKGKIQAAANAAIKTLLKVHQRGIRNVRNSGYTIAQANKHMVVANEHQSKADRQMRKTIMWFEGTNEAALTENERKLHRGQMMLAQATYAGFQHVNRRLSKIEDLLRGGPDTINAS